MGSELDLPWISVLLDLVICQQSQSENGFNLGPLQL